jgi:voltage-gated potassium channel Kch
MGSVAASCLVLLVATTVIHYEVLRLMTMGLPVLHMRGRAKLLVVIFSAFIAHAIEIVLYAIAFYLLAHYTGAGTLGAPSQLSFSRSVYFSGETYTSLGYGDIVPRGILRLLAGMEALNGLLLIGWTASYTYIAMERFWDNTDK